MSEKKFVTKDSGKREQFKTGMHRDTQEGKPLFHLIFPKGQKYENTFLYRIAMLMMRGAVKYNERNWEKARTEEELERFKSSALRHCIQWFCGETDEDHASATFFNIMGAEFVKEYLKKK